MRTVAEIRAQLREIDRDERYHYPPANTDINAPLALIQTSMEARAVALAWVLGVEPPEPGPKRKS